MHSICMGLIVSMQPLMSLGGTFSLFTFQIVINMYTDIHTYCNFAVLDLFFPFFCSLVI